MKKALSIAGFDPSGWAGVLADVRVFFDMGLMASAVVTAETAQDLTSVSTVAPSEPGLLSRQLESVFAGQETSWAVKIGMLGSGEVAEAVAGVLEKTRPRIMVLDTVLASTAGTPLVDEQGLEIIKKRLIPIATLVTPNIEEASLITGRAITCPAEMREAALVFADELQAKAVLVKGGHLKGAPIDILYDGSDFMEFEGQRLRGPAGLFHGTGCILSSALTAGLANGLSMIEAVEEAKIYTEKVLNERKPFLRQ